MITFSSALRRSTSCTFYYGYHNNYRRICPMISTIHWAYNKPKMIKGSIRCYLCRGKSNVLPAPFPRTSRYTTAIFRLFRCMHYMKYYLINRINNFIRKSNNIFIFRMRKNYIKLTNSIPCTYKKFSRMITKFPTSRAQILRATNYLSN
jgi:hypothetical protein